MTYVSCNLMGGLGNYLFQVAAAYAYGKSYNKAVGFNFEQALIVHNPPSNYKDTVLSKIQSDFRTPSTYISYKEPKFEYTAIPEYRSSSVILDGYFQSEKYFLNYSEDIKTLFTSYSVQLDDELVSIMEKENTCSVHVRRGDFLNYPNHHPAQSLDYFIKAMDTMPANSFFLVFSDDMDWCKQNLANVTNDIKFVEGYEDHQDLYTMSKCNNNIMSNSTFSWWGAWLNRNPTKKVIAPKQWFGPAYNHYQLQDLYCADWLIL